MALPNKPLVPTRNGEAPLLAAQRRRWASMARAKTLWVGCLALLLVSSSRAASEAVVLNEIASVCGEGWIFEVAGGERKGAPVEALRDALAIIYGGEFGKFQGVDFEEVAVQHLSEIEVTAVLKEEEFRRNLGADVIAALSRVRDARVEFYALAPMADAKGDFLDSEAAKRYFAAQEEAEALLRVRFGISKSENNAECD